MQGRPFGGSAVLLLPFFDSERVAPPAIVEHRVPSKCDMREAVPQPTLDGFRGRWLFAPWYGAGGYNDVGSTGADVLTLELLERSNNIAAPKAGCGAECRPQGTSRNRRKRLGEI